jgi:branched-chain amino acid transport system permease protein
MGINPSTITTIVFFTGGALAGIAGVCWGLVYGTVNPQMGFEPALKAFMIAALGTAGNLSGTVCIGIGLGIVEALSIGFMPSEYSQFRAALVFATLLTCLVLKPSGIFPQRTERA